MQKDKIQNNRTVIDHLENDPKPFISFEIIPPKRGDNIESLEGIISDLASYNPPYIDVTSHASEAIYKKNSRGETVRIPTRKRPGTDIICTIIQRTFQIDSVPHVLCEGVTRQETEDFLINLAYPRIKNVLAIRGDSQGYTKEYSPDKTFNKYASDLVKQIYKMNKGKYLDEELDAKPTNFCIGVAGYPEKHYQAPNISWDIRNLKKKIDAGAEYAVTQMFFNNKFYYNYVDKCRAHGILVPIIPGLKVISTKSNLISIPTTFYADIPEELADKIEKADESEVEDIGADWTCKQIQDLFSNGVPSVHLYIMHKTSPLKKLMQKLERKPIII